MRIVKAQSYDKRLVIMRGLPGSGKSTSARAIAEEDGGIVLSADDFFMVDGEYLFRRELLGEAHLYNQERVEKAMQMGITPVVVDNTNITASETNVYVRLASKFGYSVKYAEPQTAWKFDVKELARRNAHGVPEDVIQRMLDRWQPTDRLGIDKTASATVDPTGFARSGRLTADEQELFAILMRVVERRTPGTTVRAAGGWVRDKLMGAQPKDIDLMVDDMGGPAFARLVAEELGLSDPHVIRSNPEQSKHVETARIYMDLSSGARLEIDVAQARRDVYRGDSRIPVTTRATAEEDAHRRDLTINCLFYNVNRDEVEDFTGRGVRDIQDRVVRTPLDPAKTFSDDPLRMLRTIRFAARYGWKVAPDAMIALGSPDLREKLRRKVSRERKGIELVDMLSSGFPEVAVEMLIDTGIFEDLLRDATAESGRSERLSPPTMDQKSRHHNLTWDEHTKALARGVARKYRGRDKDKVFLVMMAALLHDAGKLDSASRQAKDDGTMTYHGHEDVSRDVAGEFMRFVKLEPLSKPVEALVGSHMRPHHLNRYDSNKSALRRFVRQMAALGIDWEDVVNIAAADAVAKGGPVEDSEREGYLRLLSDGAEVAKDMAVQKGRGVKPVLDGREIMLELGLKPGPDVGRALDAVVRMMDENPGITNDDAIRELRKGDWLENAMGNVQGNNDPNG